MSEEAHQSPVVEVVEEPSCGMNNNNSCEAAPCVTSCAAPCAAPCAPTTSYTMPCNYNQCNGDNNFNVGFRQSIRNMFRRHSESSCSDYNGGCDFNNCNPCEQQTSCEPCQPVCEPCQPVCKPCPKPVMKKGYTTEKYTVQVPFEKKIKVACQVPSSEKKVICKQVQCFKTKYVPTKVPYLKNVKETITVPTTKTVYKTQTQKCYKTETKCRKVPYWYCEEPKCVAPEPVCAPVCAPACSPCEYNPCGGDFGMRKRDRFMQGFRNMENRWDQFEDNVECKWDNSRFGRKFNEFEDSYDCNRYNSGCGGKKGFWRSFFG